MASFKKRTLFLTIITFAIIAVSLLLQGVLSAGECPSDKQSLAPAKVPLERVVLFTAKDSVVYDFDRRSMALWGKASIDHDGTRVKAPQIIIDVATSLLHAFGRVDSLKKVAEPAVFSDRQGGFQAESLTYNFQTRRGETTHVSSSSEVIKFTGERVSRLENGEMVVREGTFTTCDDADPHFWFSSPSMTINSDTGLTAKPLFMYIRPEIFSRRLPAIPVLVLPSMVFPLNTSRSSGLITPDLTNFARSTALSNLGYYWAIDDYSDLRLSGDIALNGSWRVGERLRFVKRDLFSGEVSGEYKRYVESADQQTFSDWSARIVHHYSFDSSMQLDIALQLQGGERKDDLHSMNFETMLSEQANSRASLAKIFHDENSIATLDLNRTADLRNNNEHHSAGTTFSQNRLYPFRSPSSGEYESWESAVSVTTGGSIVAESLSLNNVTFSGISGYASGELGYYREFAEGYKALLTQGILFQSWSPVTGWNDRAESGAQVVVPLKIQSTLFYHFNINPSVAFLRSRQGDGMAGDVAATIFSVDAGTRLYGTLQTGLFERVVGLKVLQHTFIPVVTYTWNSPFSGSGYDQFMNNVYGWPHGTPLNGIESTRYAALPAGQSTVALTLKNIFHAKFSGSPSFGGDGEVGEEHTAQLLSVTASTSFNKAAETFRMAPLTFLASSNVLVPNFFLSVGSMYDFYSYDPLTGARINRYNSDDGRGLLRFIKGFFNMSLSLPGDGEAGDVASYASAFAAPYDQAHFGDAVLMKDRELRFSLFLQTDRSNPLQSSHDRLINVAVNVALSKEWQAGVNTGFDLDKGKAVFPMIHLYRDLHCWQTGFQWVPSGAFKGFAFQLGLKTL
ncbi:MAG: putative LPS assembly protein LptD [Chlorobium sp.]